MSHMKICEICGAVEEPNQEVDAENNPSRVLHICEQCREERKMVFE